MNKGVQPSHSLLCHEQKKTLVTKAFKALTNPDDHRFIDKDGYFDFYKATEGLVNLKLKDFKQWKLTNTPVEGKAKLFTQASVAAIANQIIKQDANA